MTGNPCWQAIPTKLSKAQFEEFVLPHLSRGRRGPPPTLSLHKIFNYILQALYMGCQWMMLPIERNDKGRPEIHHTCIYRKMRRWQADGSIDRIFAGTLNKLHQDQLLDLSVIHGDGTTTAAKKGGDNLGYSGHKHLKGCKVVAFCDRDCNVIAPFVTRAFYLVGWHAPVAVAQIPMRRGLAGTRPRQCHAAAALDRTGTRMRPERACRSVALRAQRGTPEQALAHWGGQQCQHSARSHLARRTTPGIGADGCARETARSSHAQPHVTTVGLDGGYVRHCD